MEELQEVKAEEFQAEVEREAAIVAEEVATIYSHRVTDFTGKTLGRKTGAPDG